MRCNINFDAQRLSHLVNILGELPNKLNVFDIYQDILKQASEQEQKVNSEESNKKED